MALWYTVLHNVHYAKFVTPRRDAAVRSEPRPDLECVVCTETARHGPWRRRRPSQRLDCPESPANARCEFKRLERALHLGGSTATKRRPGSAASHRFTPSSQCTSDR